jgi:hypothetical protein
MTTYDEYRKSRRFEQRATVMIEDESKEYFSYGQMINYSEDGMLIGSDVKFKPGTKITIKFEKPLYKAAPRTYHAVVRRCKELFNDDTTKYHYEIGVKFV